MADDPFQLFDEWFAKAQAAEPNDPNAMAVASVGADGQPSLRMVLLKGHGRDGFTFFTNFESRKGGEMLAHRPVALLFHWKSLRRQIRIEGSASPVSDEEADAYFASRPRDSQIGAWASQQSRPLASRAQFLKDIAAVGARYLGREVPRPPHWSGFRVVPQRFEYWQDKPFRLHERTVFTPAADGGWDRGLLYP